MSALEVSGVRRSFGGTHVLRGIDLTLEDGERVAILGSNGAGKTTLMRILAGLLRADAGTVRVGGRTPGEAAARRATGVLGHAPCLYGRLTALENLTFWGRMYDVPAPRDEAHGLLAALGLDPDDGRTVAAYSQGMRQRVGLARALVHRPVVLLLDEPFAGLDAEGIDAAADLIARRARSVVLATHQADRASSLAARTLRLTDGRLAGTPAP